MADTEPPESIGRDKRPWAMGAAALVLFLAAAVLVAVAVPRGGSTTQRSTFVTASSAGSGNGGKGPAIELLLTVDSLAPAAGGIQARLLAAPGPALPPEGATLFNSIGSAPKLVVRPGQIDQERTAFLSFERGSASDYPFETYRVGIDLGAIRGTDVTQAQATSHNLLPLKIEGDNIASGLVVNATTSTNHDNVLTVTLTIRRSLVSRAWVLAMMAIYWALAILAACITYMVVRRRRPMETRLLAWLSAMVFALIAFRTAAPGAPPVGTFLDYFAVFESVGIVAVSLVVLMVFYLVSHPDRPRR